VPRPTSLLAPFLALGLSFAGLALPAARPAGAQRARDLAAAWARADAAAPAPPTARGPTPPSTYEFWATPAGWAFGYAGAAGGAGFLVDQAVCQQRHGHDEGGLFHPCFLYVAGATAMGWFGGALAGAALGATRVARARGCPRRAAVWRTLAGAALGVAPGALLVASNPAAYPPRRSALILGAPVFAGLGAAGAVVTCRAS
jgi:hypothetical protein